MLCRWRHSPKWRRRFFTLHHRGTQKNAPHFCANTIKPRYNILYVLNFSLNIYCVYVDICYNVICTLTIYGYEWRVALLILSLSIIILLRFSLISGAVSSYLPSKHMYTASGFGAGCRTDSIGSSDMYTASGFVFPTLLVK